MASEKGKIKSFCGIFCDSVFSNIGLVFSYSYIPSTLNKHFLATILTSKNTCHILTMGGRKKKYLSADMIARYFVL